MGDDVHTIVCCAFCDVEVAAGDPDTAHAMMEQHYTDEHQLTLDATHLTGVPDGVPTRG